MPSQAAACDTSLPMIKQVNDLFLISKLYERHIKVVKLPESWEKRQNNEIWGLRIVRLKRVK